MKNAYRWMQSLAMLLSIGLVPGAQAQVGLEDCGPLKSRFGPLDYRTATPADRALIEDAHFRPEVEQLRGGGRVVARSHGHNIGYTLNVFPNHPRALIALMKFAEKEKTDKPIGEGHSVTCRFKIAERFKPDDATVKALYGVYLLRKGKPKDAVDKMQAALAIKGDNGNFYHNLGLAYFEMGEFDKSLESAHRAHALGFQLPGLKEKLKRAGKWQDPAVAAPASLLAPPEVGVASSPAPGNPLPDATRGK